MCNSLRMPNLDVISAVEAAEILGVSRDTVLRWATEPKLASVKLPGTTGARVFDRADVLRLKSELDAAADSARERAS
jgi:excisionase family DNA binding protein